jgi:hypothetical protein
MLPSKIDWDEIRGLYNQASICFWGPRDGRDWRRKEDDGWFYLWNAYHYASASDDEEIDHRTYARILVMLARKLAYKISDYDRYHKYVLPAAKEYKMAMEHGQVLADGELARIKREYGYLTYKLQHENES